MAVGMRAGPRDQGGGRNGQAHTHFRQHRSRLCPGPPCAQTTCLYTAHAGGSLGTAGQVAQMPSCLLSFPRSGGVLPPGVQHTALCLLQHPPSVPLRPEKRQVLLAGQRRAPAHDTAVGGGHPPLHQPLCRVRGPGSGGGAAQPGPVRAPVPAGLAEPLDRVLLPHGESLHPAVSSQPLLSPLHSNSVNSGHMGSSRTCGHFPSLSMRLFFSFYLGSVQKLEMIQASVRVVEFCVHPTGLHCTCPQQSQSGLCGTISGKMRKSGPDLGMSPTGSGVVCVCLSPNSLVVLAAHRRWGPRRRAGPHVTRQLPGRFPSNSLPRMPRPAGNLPLLCKQVQLLADDGQTTLAIFRSTFARNLKGKPGPAPENQQVSGLHEGQLENPGLAHVPLRDTPQGLSGPGLC